MNSAAYNGLTVLIPASNEKESLMETIRKIVDVCDRKDLSEIVVFLKSPDCPSSEVCHMIGSFFDGVPFRFCVQKNADKLTAYAEMPFLVKSSHFVILTADLEMNPMILQNLLDITKKYPDAIVCAAKWVKGSVLHQYGRLQGLASRTVNRVAARIIDAPYKDLFTAYQIYPKTVFDRMGFSVSDRTFFEYTLKPVSLGVPYFEIPTVYWKRTEGKSSMNVFGLAYMAIRFIGTAIQIKKLKEKNAW